MFKIVQTQETGHKAPLLSIVPGAWEKNNYLYWPNTKKISVLNAILRDATSRPKEGWLKQACIKKRDNFLTYEAAELELEAMTRNTDTDFDTEEEQERIVKKRREIGRTKPVDFNNFMENNNPTEFSCSKNKRIADSKGSPSHCLVDEYLEFEQPSAAQSEGDISNLESEAMVSEDQDVQSIMLVDKAAVINFNDILENQKKLFENLANITNSQERILKELANHRTMLDVIYIRFLNENISFIRVLLNTFNL